MRYTRRVGNLAALIVTGGLGVLLIVGGAGVVSFSSVSPYFDRMPGSLFMILVGAVLLAVAVRFLLAVADERLGAALFSRAGSLGRIELTPNAVKEFISGILRDEIGVQRFRVDLRHQGDGVAISVRLTLSPEQRVTNVGELIQRELTEHVRERTGVEVGEVSVLVRSIRADASRAASKRETADAADAER